MTKQAALEEAHTFREFNGQIIAHMPQLRRQAMALTRHKADAEDLLQTAVTSAIMARESFTPGTNFKAWITCILRNRFLSNIRQRRFNADIGDVPEGLLGRNGQQESHLDMIELQRQMQRLPADQRAILIMIAVEGMSYDEASEILGVAAGTLKCRVFRARAQLVAWMHGQEHGVKPTSGPGRPLKPTPQLEHPVKPVLQLARNFKSMPPATKRLVAPPAYALPVFSAQEASV